MTTPAKLGAGFSDAERMTSPFGGCYAIGGEQTGGAVDARLGCYMFDGVPDSASPLANATVPAFDARDWSALTHGIVRHVSRSICKLLGHGPDCMDALVNPKPFAQVLM